ncbi:hypothetical protein QNM97_14000 [Gordonia sp. L191]|uniref:hypothetical protein n=1 Tax=Gordonia sp. L191 TaxID=2982699 RepID=UPI0024C0D268|nr:hypothetical protein [Gordonia sp. L191]WHU45165.1 hypothetical protein QNM97_14000 [Gordonia sp. L191]
MVTTFEATMLAIGGIASAIAIIADLIRASMSRRWEPIEVDRGRINGQSSRRSVQSQNPFGRRRSGDEDR